jgi:hypothetical protein
MKTLNTTSEKLCALQAKTGVFEVCTTPTRTQIVTDFLSVMSVTAGTLTISV